MGSWAKNGGAERLAQAPRSRAEGGRGAAIARVQDGEGRKAAKDIFRLFKPL